MTFDQGTSSPHFWLSCGIKTVISKCQSICGMLVCLWSLAFVVRLFWIWPLHYNDWFGDACFNVRIAEDIAEGKDTSWVGSDSPFFVFTPLYHLLVALVILFTSLNGMTSAKLVSAFSTSFVSPLLYVLIHYLTNQRRLALVGAIIAIFVPWFLAVSVMTLATGLYITFAVASCTALICIKGNKRVPLSLILSGLAALTRPEGAFLFFFTMTWVLVVNFRHRKSSEWRVALLSTILISVGTVAIMMVIWQWRAGDPFVWITSMLSHQAEETQKGKLTIPELLYLFLIILATYSGFGGNPEPARLDLYNLLRIGFATLLLILIGYGIYVVLRDLRRGKFTEEVRDGYLFILTSWTSMLIFLILLDGRWIKYHVLGVILIQPLFIAVATFDLVRRVNISPPLARWLRPVTNRPTIILMIILSILSLQFMFAFTTSALVKSQLWEPRRELVDWLNNVVPKDTVVIIPHREYYVTAYSQVSSMDYTELYDEVILMHTDLNQTRLLSVCQELKVLYLVTTSDYGRQEDPYYTQIIELIDDRITVAFTSTFEWRSLSITLEALEITYN